MLTEGANLPMTHLRATFHKIWWIVNNSPHLPSCLVSADRTSITIHGTPVLIADIPLWYQGLLDDAEALLKKTLFGLEFPEFEELVSGRLDPSKPQDAFIDDHNNRDVGYSFLTEGKNGLQQFENTLLRKIFGNEELNLLFHAYDSDGQPYPRRGTQLSIYLPYLIHLT